MTSGTIITIMAILATYRISRMIVGEQGPFNLFDNLRGYIMKRYPPDHWLYNGIGCPLCISFWVAAIFALWATPTPLMWPVYWLGIAGANVIIYRRIE